MVITFSAGAQNLVPNGDFEDYTQCPDYVSQIDRASGWFRPTEGTSDYLHACLGVPWSLSVPDNSFGNETAHSGQGYAGFYCFYANDAAGVPGDDDREYVTHALSEPLVPGTTYAVEFFVSLADVSKYAVRDIGALLSMTAPLRSDELAIEGVPQVRNSTLALLDEKDGWMRINGCFVADSAYGYITIGNFNPAATTAYDEMPTIYPLTFYSYYFVDDVSVRMTTAPDVGPDREGCEAIELAVSDPLAESDYVWSTGEAGSSILANSTGIYIVTFSNGGCTLSDTVLVEVFDTIAPLLPIDTIVDLCRNSSVLIEAGGLPPNATVHWNTGATTPMITVREPGTYTITAEAPDHCPGMANITVIDGCRTPLYVPNCFTPNGDGVNDHWGPTWIAKAEVTLEFWVYDRWGRPVAFLREPDATWDGTIDGAPVPDGLYAWGCRTTGPDYGTERSYNGHVLLMR